jgi:hypothetical protein
MAHDTAGDPVRGLKWTRKTTQKIADELKRFRQYVSANTVGRLLKAMGFRLRVNHKKNEINANVDPAERNQQFQTIKRQRICFENQGLPVISVDSKAKELVGNFKNDGKAYGREPENVDVYDFPSDADGKAVPYGVYDTIKNQGFVNVGTSYDTPSFAVDSIEAWWLLVGQHQYPNADRLLILADCGGSNSARSRVWKYELQEKLCRRHGLEITICHFPPGCSKWNPIEHRLFSAISRNWSGVPLRSWETIVNHIRTTTTTKGLSVRARLDRTKYEKGKRISDAQMKQFGNRYLRCHEEFPSWNYNITAEECESIYA